MNNINNINWFKTIPFESNIERNENWYFFDSDNIKNDFSIDVTFGKSVDILNLKLNILENLKENIKKVKESREEIFSNLDNLEEVCNCPVCGSKRFFESIKIYNAQYVKCNSCYHIFLKFRPTKNAIEEFYSKDAIYQKTYADRRTTDIRVKQVALPKAKWVIDKFVKNFGREPKSILDVGAGSGHFVSACRQLGYRADGIELSEHGIAFCKNVFGFDLFKNDFISDWDKFQDYDIITFWGVIEHVPYPLSMLSSASNIFNEKDGFIVCSVPRWNSVSTAIQELFVETVVRHLDPLGHLHIFSDSSIAISYIKSGIKPTDVWYFGMDAYELLIQLTLKSNDNNFLEYSKEIIPNLQTCLDKGLLSDEIVIAGISNYK